MKIPNWLKSAKGFTMATGGPTRVDTWLVNVQVENIVSGNMVNLGTFDKSTGGDLQAGSTTYRAGGMQPPIALGGLPAATNVVVSRLYRLERDHDNIQMLLNGVAKAKMVVTKQPLDLDGNTYGKPIVLQGLLDGVKSPEPDSTSAAEGALELTMVVSGYPTST